MSDDVTTTPPPTPPLLRSGTAARLAGISTATLRVWEHRYGVVAPPKSAAGQRSYSMDDIERLRLIKQLTVEGHAIGSVARLDGAALLELAAGPRSPPAAGQRVVVVGQAAARKLQGLLRPAPAHVIDDLALAQRDVARIGAADVLVLHVPALDAGLPPRVLALQASLPAQHVVVVYAFGTAAVADALRAAGVTVRRDPLAGRDLARLVMALRPATAARPDVLPAHARRFTSAELVALTEMPSMVACECPRHLAEIVGLLVGFEAYSQQCAARSADDAALHRDLLHVAGAARSALEAALHRVVVEEGLELPRERASGPGLVHPA